MAGLPAEFSQLTTSLPFHAKTYLQRLAAGFCGKGQALLPICSAMCPPPAKNTSSGACVSQSYPLCWLQNNEPG